MPDRTRHLSGALVVVALVGAVIGSLGAPLITPVSRELGVSLNDAQWTLTITLLVGAVAGPVLGRLGGGAQRRSVILGALVAVVIGAVLTTAPGPFWLLLVGRGLQGLALGSVPLLMSVARSHLPDERGRRSIAALSVTSTVGIGVGYPLVGWIDDLAGLRAAYGLGLVLAVIALVVAWWAVPREAPAPPPRIDIVGAVLLGVGTLGVLVAIAVPAVWASASSAVLLPLVTVGVLVAWVVVELRTPTPLVDLRLLARPTVLRANGAMLVSGIGMYLLFSLFTRFLQTPADAGYGFALAGVAAGAALIPFSALGFVAGRTTPPLIVRVGDRGAFVVAIGAVMLAAVVFAAGTTSLILVLVAMAVLGFGVGAVSAVMPALVLTGVPAAETASVLTVNQVLRQIGFSVGSALAGAMLAAATPAEGEYPTPDGYLVAAWWALPPLALSLIALLVSKRGSSGQ
ncbi:MFS transporter [Microbacterium gorillae]|uniref:MFS transporter n=1 Tax=Microbacterium gorillae TaxID=1231063 RepID=UPI00058B764D|nr:MFS transporter [Microbacterium gorillae]